MLHLNMRKSTYFPSEMPTGRLQVQQIFLSLNKKKETRVPIKVLCNKDPQICASKIINRAATAGASHTSGSEKSQGCE